MQEEEIEGGWEIVKKPNDTPGCTTKFILRKVKIEDQREVDAEEIMVNRPWCDHCVDQDALTNCPHYPMPTLGITDQDMEEINGMVDELSNNWVGLVPYQRPGKSIIFDQLQQFSELSSIGSNTTPIFDLDDTAQSNYMDEVCCHTLWDDFGGGGYHNWEGMPANIGIHATLCGSTLAHPATRQNEDIGSSCEGVEVPLGSPMSYAWGLGVDPGADQLGCTRSVGGGYLHGAKSLTYGVDILRIRWMGILQVICGSRGDLSPACNSAGMIDRYVLGVSHLYAKPAYGNLKECNKTKLGIPESSPSWCHTPFDPEGILGSLTAAVTCIIGLQFGHILVHMQDHKERLRWWSMLSIYCSLPGALLAILGVPLNKSLYTVSYALVTSGSAGFTFNALYLLVGRRMGLQTVDVDIGVDGSSCPEHFHPRHL
ncbi:hypothetical protein KSS87_013605 [Heliosperma pusillum]|nr:hypothetical protein KSS87_013605 [Heliosperma pusillum]